MDSPTAPTPQQQVADLRTLQILWAALMAGVAVMTGIMGGLAVAGSGPAAPENAALFFYLNAALNLAAIIAAFAVQRRLMDRLLVTGTYAEFVATVRTSGIISLALLEASALVACVVAFLTGELINLLFVVPFFAFALLFFPTAARFESLLDLARRK